MSIPRAKIEGRFATCGECDETPLPFPGIWFGRVLTIGDIADSAREHLRDAHGVRTVGSLTADDIGKWIEVEDNAPFRITKLWHGQRTLIGSDGLGATFTGPSSVVCRVTEERP